MSSSLLATFLDRNWADVEARGGKKRARASRRHYVSHTVDWLSTDRRFPGEPRFPALAMIGMIEATVERDGKTSVARRCLPSALLSAKQLAHAASRGAAFRAIPLPGVRLECFDRRRAMPDDLATHPSALLEIRKASPQS